MRCHVVVGVAFLALASAGAGAERPLPVSPGGASDVAVVAGRCPTFHWTAAEGASSVDLAVYRVPEEEADGPPERVLAVTLPGSAHGWTPSLGQCLESGEQYAWAVGTGGSWSEPTLFEIAAGPSTLEIRQALELLQAYLATRGTAGPTPSTAAPAVEDRERIDTIAFNRAGAGSFVPALNGPSEAAKLQVEAPLDGALSLQGVRGATEDEDAFAAGVIGEATSSSMVSQAVGVIGRSSGRLGDGVRGSATGDAGVGGRFFGTGSAQAIFANASTCCDANETSDHAVLFANFSTDADPDVLALWVNQLASTRVNYITFFDRLPGENPRVSGHIQGDGNGGVHYRGSHVTLTPTETPLACNQTIHEGRIYFDDSLNKPCFCDGTGWQQMDGGGSC